MIGIFLDHHQTSGHSHLPLGSTVQHVATAAPPQHREDCVTFKCTEGLRGVGQVEAQARAGSQVEEAMLRDPLPQHVARGPFAVLQNQVRAIHRDATLQWFTLQDEEALVWEEEHDMTSDRKGGRYEEQIHGGENEDVVVETVSRSIKSSKQNTVGCFCFDQMVNLVISILRNKLR